MSGEKRRNSLGPVVLGIAGLALLAGAVIVALTAQGGPESPATVPPAPQTVARVSVAEARAALEAGSAVFVDVRDSEAYAASHVPGARSIPLGELADRAMELDPESWIITYCT